MAVGDILVARSASGNFYLQPAVGVEVMITAVFGSSTAVEVGIYSVAAAAQSKTAISSNTTSGNKNTLNTKIGITNANYLYLYGNSNSAYSGIQIK